MEELQQRWQKKKKNIHNIAENIQSLRNQVTRDLSSDDEKLSLTALVVAIMDKTGERVGNETSKENGHLGITGLDKRNVTINGNEVTLKYVGKSGVSHEKSFSNENIAKYLKQAIINSPTSSVFTTSNDFKIKSDKVNRYLSSFDVTAKDLRGYSANKWVVDKLNEVDIEETESKRKRQFNKVVSSVAEKIGHGKTTLKNHYLFPSIEYNFVMKSKVSEVKDVNMMKIGGSLSKTPAPKEDRIYGSKVNKPMSASSKESAKKITLANEIIDILEHKLRDFKKEHKSSNITLNSLKAVYRRGLGAYSKSHRPTITGGKTNTRNAWAMARVNAFLKKASGEKVKKAYIQDDDLMEQGGEILKGGRADKLTIRDIAEFHNQNYEYVFKQYKKGIKHELEHTSDFNIAKEIAKDHLYERVDYYDMLDKLEKTFTYEIGGL